jgi:CopG family nickel-responsive transcriptional regulator
MTEKLIRIGISLPDDLLRNFDTLLINSGHSTRSDAIRDAMRRYIQYHSWMNKVKGERIGIFEMVYTPFKRDLPASIARILSESNQIVLSSIQIHISDDNYLRVIIMCGEGEHIVKLAEQLMALSGVKQEKLITMPFDE